MRSKLAIVGTHRDTRDLAPFDDPDYDIWVFNEAMSQWIRNENNEPYKWVKRADAVFQLHTPDVYRSPNNRSDRYHWDWLQEEHGNLVIYMQDNDPQVPNSMRLPIENLDGLLANFRQGIDRKHRRYLTSSPSIALALGILMGYPVIEIYGCNMGSETEYQFQREGFTFWIGYALGHGIQVDMISGDDIFDRPVYGFDGYIESPPELFKERIAQLKEEIKAARQADRQAEDKLAEGWSNGAGDLITALAASKTNLGYLEGALFENERYLFKVEQMVRDGGIAFIDRNEYEMAAADANKALMKLGPNVYRTIGHVDLTLETYKFTQNPVHLPQLQYHAGEHFEANYNFGKMQGKFDENRRLAIEMDKKLKAAGGKKTVQSLMGAPQE